MDLLNYWSYRIKRIKNKPQSEILTFGLKTTKLIPYHIINKIKLKLNISLSISNNNNLIRKLQIDNLLNNEKIENSILNYFIKRTNINFYFESNALIKKDYIINFDDELKNLIFLNNNYINKDFYFLGRSYKFIDKIDWHTDFNGNKWPLKYFTNINYFNNDTDIKLTWELNRHHHLSILGMTYFITKDEKYAKEVCDQIESWIIENPYLFGVNWAEGIEVAIRTYSWIFAYFYILNSKNITPEINFKILKNIYQNGIYLKNFLSDKWIVNNNHIIAELSGLLLIGILFPEFKDSKEWINFSFDKLRKELKKQVLNDGVLWEHSIGYHKFVTEMLLYPIILARINNYEIPSDILQTIEKMLEFLNCISMNNGKIPLMGDEDQGFMLKLNDWDYADINGISTIGGNLFGRSDWIRNKSELAFWLLNGFIPSDIKKTYGYPSFRVFESSGYSIFKSKCDYLLFITCAQNDIYLHAAHRHIDMLSFTYESDGEYFIVDNGTYIYNGNEKKRNLFRSIWMHNTITIDQQNPCELSSFEMNPRPKAKIVKYGMIEKQNYVWAKHTGYYPLIHNRIVVQLDPGYLLYDWIEGNKKNRLFESYIHLHPDIKFKRISKNMVELEKNTKSIFITLGQDFELVDSQFSPKYGVVKDSKALRIKEKTTDFSGFIGLSNNSDINFENIIEFIKNRVIRNA